MKKTSDQSYNENVVITRNIEKKHLNLTRDKSSQDKISEITQAICAFFNSCEGYLKLHFDDESVALKAQEPKVVDDLVRRIEQGLMKFVGPATVTTAFQLEETPQEERGLLFGIKRASQFCTVAYNLYLPTDFQINVIGPSDTTKEVAAILAPGKRHNGSVNFPEQDTTFVYGEKIAKGLREGQTTQFKLLKDKPETNVTLADRMVNKTNKVVNCVSAFANKNGGKVYFGIDDKTYIVKGQVVNQKEQKKIEKTVSAALSKMVWPVKDYTEFYHLEFVPVVTDELQLKDTFVIVLSVAQCPGGVFVAEPESYEIDDGKVRRIKMSAWKKKVILDARSGCINNDGCKRSDCCSNSMADLNVNAGSVDNGACSCTSYIGIGKSKDSGCNSVTSSDNGVHGGNSDDSCYRHGGLGECNNTVDYTSVVASNNSGCSRDGSYQEWDGGMGDHNNNAVNYSSLVNFHNGIASNDGGGSSDNGGYRHGGMGSTTSTVNCRGGMINSYSGADSSNDVGREKRGMGDYNDGASTGYSSNLSNMGIGYNHTAAAGFNNGASSNTGNGYYFSTGGIFPSPSDLVNQSSGNHQSYMYIPNHVRVIGWNSSKQLEDYMKVTQLMENLRNNGDWTEIDRIAKKILVPKNTNADLKLAVIFQCIAASYRQTKNEQAYKQLGLYHDLLKLAKNRAIFEVQELYSWSAIKRSERNYQQSYQYTYDALQKMQFIVPGWITAWYLCNAASLLTIFACETADHIEKMNLVDQAVCYYREALEHGKSILSYKEAAANLQHRVHINLAMLYMRSSPNVNSNNFKQFVAQDLLKFAEESLKAAESFEGPPMSGFNEFHFLLAKSDLCFRYFQLNPDDNQEHLKKAIDYANQASSVAKLKRFEEVLHYAETRFSLFNRIPQKKQNIRDIVDSVLNEISF